MTLGLENTLCSVALLLGIELVCVKDGSITLTVCKAYTPFSAVALTVISPGEKADTTPELLIDAIEELPL